MKKTVIIALSCLAVLFAACKKPVEPTPTPTPTPEPEPVDYTVNYVGNYLGQFILTIKSMNNQPQTSLDFPVDSICMEIAKSEKFNTITATVTVDSETRQTTGTATAEKADFETVHLLIDKPDQHYTFNVDLKMEGSKVSDTLNVIGTFSGDGAATIMGQDQVFDEVSGTISGRLLKH